MRRSALAVVASAAVVSFASTALAITIIDEGTAVVDSAVSCGTHSGRIVVRTGVHYQTPEDTEAADRPNGVSIAFVGSKALDCCWAQFVWVEVIATVRTGTTRGQALVPGAMNTTSGRVPLTMDAANPSWHLDSISSKDPCYETTGVSIKTSNGTTVFDHPVIAPVIGPSIAKGLSAQGYELESLECRFHAEAFLVCDHHICFVVSWTSVDTWTPHPSGGSSTSTGPNYAPPPSGQVANAIRPRQKAALDAQEPGETVIPH